MERRRRTTARSACRASSRWRCSCSRWWCFRAWCWSGTWYRLQYNVVGAWSSRASCSPCRSLMVIRLLMDPDSVRARQSELDAAAGEPNPRRPWARNGMDERSGPDASARLLLPVHRGHRGGDHRRSRSILGYAGYGGTRTPPAASSARTPRTPPSPTARCASCSRPRRSGSSQGHPRHPRRHHRAAVRGRRHAGHAEVLLPPRRHISETQKSIAEGFGQLLSTQMAAAALEEQTKLGHRAWSSRCSKARSTRTSCSTPSTPSPRSCAPIRARARVLLREFAVFYRRTLEDSADLIQFRREMEQTQRYFTFELARFGADRVELIADIEPSAWGHAGAAVPHPAPGGERGAPRHARRGQAHHHRVRACIEGDDVIVSVADDGNGMTEEARENILHPASATGLGIAVKNVHDRIMRLLRRGLAYGSGKRAGSRAPRCAWFWSKAL